MPFDISDDRLRRFIEESEDVEELSVEDIEDIDRNRRNFLVFSERTAQNTFFGISIAERSFEEDELEKALDNEITELG